MGEGEEGEEGEEGGGRRGREEGRKEGRGVQRLQQRTQFESCVEFAQLRHVRFVAAQLFGADVELDVAADPGEFTRQREIRRRRAQAFADLAFDAILVLQQAVERAVLVEPLCRRLRADLRHAGNVVRGVADEREVVDDLFGVDVELELDAGPVEGRVRHGVDERDVLVDQLRHVLVAGRDQHLQARVHGTLCERADDVVCLDTCNSQQRQAERLHGVDQRLDLGAKVVRHRRPVRLVLREQLVAKRLAGRIEHDGDELRVLLALHAQQHVEHAEHGTRRLPARICQRRQRVEGPVQVGRAVHEHQCARINHRGRCLACRPAAAAAGCARPWAWPGFPLLAPQA